jgi:hypothetical protein
MFRIVAIMLFAFHLPALAAPTIYTSNHCSYFSDNSGSFKVNTRLSGKVEYGKTSRDQDAYIVIECRLNTCGASWMVGGVKPLYSPRIITSVRIVKQDDSAIVAELTDNAMQSPTTTLTLHTKTGSITTRREHKVGDQAIETLSGSCSVSKL